MVVALSVACAVFYGAADFCGGLATRRMPTFVVVVWSQAVGLMVLLAALPLVGGAPRASDLAWGLACGVAGAVAVATLYRALAVGTMGVVSPITAVLAAAVPVAFALVRGDRPAQLALGGIALALLAVILVSVAPPTPNQDADAPLARMPKPNLLGPGIPEALVAGCAFGFLFIALAQTHAGAGLYPLLSMRLTSLAVLAGTGFAVHAPLRIHRPGLPLVALCGGMDMGSNILFIVAVHTGALSVVAVISSLYPAATVALAAALLHERLGGVQWSGVVLALAGIACIALAR